MYVKLSGDIPAAEFNEELPSVDEFFRRHIFLFVLPTRTFSDCVLTYVGSGCICVHSDQGCTTTYALIVNTVMLVGGN